MKTQTGVEEEGDILLIIKDRNMEVNTKSFAKNILRLDKQQQRNRAQVQACIGMNEILALGNVQATASWAYDAFSENTHWKQPPAKGQARGAWSHLEKMAGWHLWEGKAWGDTSEVRY